MKKYFSFLILVLLLSACSKKKISVPDDVVPMKDMQSILTDIHLAQAAVGNASASDSSLYNTQEYVNYILKDHNVGREKFLSSLKFYSENPALLEEVYDSVITKLSKMQSESELN